MELLCADDTVLMVDLGMKLQTMLEVVQAYVMRWRMSSIVGRARLWYLG